MHTDSVFCTMSDEYRQFVWQRLEKQGALEYYCSCEPPERPCIDQVTQRQYKSDIQYIEASCFITAFLLFTIIVFLWKRNIKN